MFRKLGYDGIATKQLTITVDGLATEVEAGEPIAAVLLRLAPFTARTSPVTGAVRAPFCMMGACFECLVEIDGVTSVRSCMTRARGGMVVRRQTCRPDPLGTTVA
jgi:predicted molibdopterin-dependent oxidoreductase YjgC